MLTRVEPHDLKYPMIVNDQRVELPVIHLKGDFTVVGKDPRPRICGRQRAAARSSCLTTRPIHSSSIGD